MKKTTSLIIGLTILATILVLVVVYFIVGACSPITLAKMYEHLNSSTSIKYYIKNYEKNKTINNLYAIVDKSIAFENNDVLLEYYPMLLEEDGYESLITKVNELNYDKNASIKQNLFLYNEDNRLKTRYVTALSKDDYLEAFEFAYKDFLTNEQNFVFVGLRNVIGKLAARFDSTVVNGIINRFNEKISYYDSIKNDSSISDFDKAKECYDSLEICQFILLLDDNGVDIVDSQIFVEHKNNLASDLSSYIL